MSTMAGVPVIFVISHFNSFETITSTQ
jgi:hypothetical protein